MNTDALIDVLFRWAHVISGITWIGLLYFFNFVNVPTQGKLDGDTKKKVNPELLPRALFWFRWAAMSTLVFGLLLFWWLYLRELTPGMPNPNLKSGDGLSGRALYIMIGMTFGIVMWFNVWFVIWPAQRQIIGGIKSGTPAPAHLPKRALLFSRINTFLSGPMLMLMFLAPHGQMDFRMDVFGIALAVGLLVPFLAIKGSAKVSTDV